MFFQLAVSCFLCDSAYHKGFIFNKDMFYFFCFIIFNALLSQFAFSSVEDSYYVLFRGFHFTPGQVIQPKHMIDSVTKTDCKSVYTSQASLTSDQSENLAKKLQTLYASGSVKKEDVYFPSAYDAMQEYFVNEYANMRAALKKDSSEIRRNLHAYDIHCNDIFLISTSLSSYIALKYAAGLCTPGAYRRNPVRKNAKNELIVENPILGYVDIFFIPFGEMKLLYPYFVVEEFARHHITLPYKLKQKDYTIAEEVNFPFLIPGKYHHKRLAVDVSTFPFGNWKNPDDCMRYYLRKFATDIDAHIKKLFLSSKKNQIFVGPLAHSCFKVNHHIMPAEAIKVRHKINERIDFLVEKFFDNNHKSFDIEDIDIDFHLSFALENLGLREYPINISTHFSLEKSKVRHLLAFINAPYITELKLIGEDTLGVTMEEDMEHNRKYGIFSNNAGFQEFPWRSPHRLFKPLVSHLKRRKNPLTIDITGQSLDHESFGLLMDSNNLIEIVDDNRDGDEEEEQNYLENSYDIPDEEESISDNEYDY